MTTTTRTVFIIDDGAQIKPVDYVALVNSYAEETTTPKGIGRVDFVEPVVWFAVPSLDGYAPSVYEYQRDAEDAADEEGIPHAAIKEIQRYELKSWNRAGKTDTFKVFDSEQEAEKQLFEFAEHDFNNCTYAPEYFEDMESAILALAGHAE